MSVNKQNYGQPFSVTASGTSVAIATQSGTTGTICYATDIAASSTGTTSGTWAVLAGATSTNATTILWQGAGVVNYQFSEPLASFLGGSLYMTSNGTTFTYINLSGFLL